MITMTFPKSEITALQVDLETLWLSADLQ